MSAQGGHGTDAVDASIESSLHPSIDLSRRRNFLASPLLRLPTELILNIFVHVIESDDCDNDYCHSRLRNLSLFALTAICHQLREIGTASPQLWNCVEFTVLPIAELFLERCEYNPRILLVKESGPRWPPQSVLDPRREAVWEKLEGRTFSNLHSLVFKGAGSELALRVISVLQRAPNVSNLDLNGTWFGSGQELPWPIDDAIPSLSILRLHKFSIGWTSPLLRNLTRLTLDSGSPSFPPKPVSIETFLAALANCPNLEIPNLTNSRPEPINSHHDECDVVVQLCRLRELSLEFRDPSTVGYVLLHIGYPESTKLAVYVPGGVGTDLSETISRVFPHRNVQTIQHFRKSTALTVHLDDHPQFLTNTLLVHFQGTHFGLRRTQGLVRFASKIVEVVGGDTIISLDIEARREGPPNGMWEALLHGLSRLERICYNDKLGRRDRDLISSFILVFSRPFEGGPVCPKLRHLKLLRGVLTQHSSATVLKHALTERDACGRRLKRIGISGEATQMDNWLVLAPFRDLVDKVG